MARKEKTCDTYFSDDMWCVMLYTATADDITFQYITNKRRKIEKFLWRQCIISAVKCKCDVMEQKIKYKYFWEESPWKKTSSLCLKKLKKPNIFYIIYKEWIGSKAVGM